MSHHQSYLRNMCHDCLGIKCAEYMIHLNKCLLQPFTAYLVLAIEWTVVAASLEIGRLKFLSSEGTPALWAEDLLIWNVVHVDWDSQH